MTTAPIPTPEQLAAFIDHTLLKPDATVEQIEQLCCEARQYHFVSVCVNPTYVDLCSGLLYGSGVKVCTVVGFPLGANMHETKVTEASLAIAQGAAEIDMVLNIGALKSGNTNYAAHDIQQVTRAVHQSGAIIKVIIETALLSQAEKITACLISQEAGADFVKTSTGFSSSGATAEDVALMRKTVGAEMGVKASGGIRTAADAIKMITAGATRIGASASVKIIEELRSNSRGDAVTEGY